MAPALPAAAPAAAPAAEPAAEPDAEPGTGELPGCCGPARTGVPKVVVLLPAAGLGLLPGWPTGGPVPEMETGLVPDVLAGGLAEAPPGLGLPPGGLVAAPETGGLLATGALPPGGLPEAPAGAGGLPAWPAGGLAAETG